MSDAPQSLAPNEAATTGTLPPHHEAQITTIRSTLQRWLQAKADVKKGKPESKQSMATAIAELSELQLAEPFAFTPSPPKTYQPVLLSIAKCYWMALIASLSDNQKNEMGKRLDCIPPFQNRVPQFNGKRCVEKPDELTAKEYEGLMRTAVFVCMGMVSNDVIKMWREFAEVGVQTWEEEPYIEDSDEDEEYGDSD